MHLSQGGPLSFTAADSGLQARAVALLHKHRLGLSPFEARVQAREVKVQILKIVTMLFDFNEKPFCYLGYVAACLLVYWKGRDERLLKEAFLFFGGARGQHFDLSSSSDWPFGVWDLLLNGGGRRLAATTFAETEPRARTVFDVYLPFRQLVDHEVVATGRTTTRSILVATYVQHPGLDLELCSFLKKHFPDIVEVGLVFDDVESSYIKTEGM